MAGANGADPTAGERILAAATRAYGERGSAVTLDEVAAAAGVPRATLDRHFPTEAALREAINERLIAISARILGDEPASDEEEFDLLARRVTDLVREHVDEVRFVARAAADGDPDGLAMFDAFMAFALASFQGMKDGGVLEPDLDVEWAALHVVVFNLASVLYRKAIENHLPEPLSDPVGLERWHTADTELFRRGFLRRGLEQPRGARR